MNSYPTDKELRYLESLTPDHEVFGLIGAGYPNSFYKLYVRAPGAKQWWRFEHGAGPSRIEPINDQRSVQVTWRAVSVWARVSQLVEYQCHPDKPALVRLMERVREVSR